MLKENLGPCKRVSVKAVTKALILRKPEKLPDQMA